MRFEREEYESCGTVRAMLRVWDDAGNLVREIDGIASGVPAAPDELEAQT